MSEFQSTDDVPVQMVVRTRYVQATDGSTNRLRYLFIVAGEDDYCVGELPSGYHQFGLAGKVADALSNDLTNDVDNELQELKDRVLWGR